MTKKHVISLLKSNGIKCDYHRAKWICKNEWWLESVKNNNYECKICKSKDYLLVHHVDESRKLGVLNNNQENLITLCRSCHGKVHTDSNIKDRYYLLIKDRSTGMTYQEIGDRYNISRQRAHQIINKTLKGFTIRI